MKINPQTVSLFINKRLQKNKLTKICYRALLSVLFVAPILAKAQPYCNPGFSPIPNLTICDAPYDLSGLVSVPPGTNGTFFSGTGITGNYFYPTIAGVGTFTITYHHGTPCGPGAANALQAVTVSNTNMLQILSNGANLTKYTYTPSIGCTLTVANATNYNAFKWYKNGFEIPGANCSTCSTLVVTDMGTYTLKAYATTCGMELQDEVEIACDCSYSTATVIGTPGMTTNLTTNLNGSGGIGSSTIDYVF
jgi:hypothetical protein